MQLYTTDDYAQRQSEQPYGRMPSVSAQTNYAYEAQTWGYGGGNSNGAAMMGGTGRMKPSSSRRGQLPSVSREQPWKIRAFGLTVFLDMA